MIVTKESILSYTFFSNWHQIAKDKQAWNAAGEAYVQEWTKNGC